MWNRLSLGILLAAVAADLVSSPRLYAACEAYLSPKREDIESKYVVWENGQAVASDAAYAKALKEELIAKGEPVFQGFLPEAKWRAVLADLPFQNEIDFTPSEARLRRTTDEFYLLLKGAPTSAASPRSETIPQVRRLAIITLDAISFTRLWPETKGARLPKLTLKKIIARRWVEFSYFPALDLLTAETEYKPDELSALDRAAPFENLGRDVTHDANYHAAHLAH